MPDSRAARRLIGLRKTAMGATLMLLVQYGLGVGVNLYVNIPKADQGHGFWTAFWRALSDTPLALAFHAALGLLLLVAAVNVLTRSVAIRQAPAIAASAIALLTIIGAAISGAQFVNKGNAGASMTMAILTGVALLCYVLILFMPPRPPRRKPAR